MDETKSDDRDEIRAKRLKISHCRLDNEGTGYKDMLFAVGENLTSAQVDDLAILADLSIREKDDIHHHKGNKSLYLFRVLEEKGKLGEDDVFWLLNNLTMIRNRVASKIVNNYLSGKESSTDFPSEPGSTSSDNNICGNSFQDFLSEVGFQDNFPGKLTLKMFLTVKDRAEGKNYVDYFWQQLTSLDYRAGFPEHSLSNKVSMRDFIFGFLHCGDDFVRQDVLEKMSACQLAVPVVLKGINGVPTKFLLWAVRRIRKKWKGTYDSLATEQPIVGYPVFTVSVVRIGEVKVSKSQVLNSMLSYSQGNALHSYFLCCEKDVVKPKFSQGCIECAWFLPMCGNEKEIFHEVIAFLNLRGDCREYADQRNFVCKYSSLTIAFIASNKREENVQLIREMKQLSKNILFVSIKGEDSNRRKTHKVHYPKYIDNWLFVKVLQVDVLSKTICDIIVHISSREDKSITRSLESLATMSKILLDEQNKLCQKAKRDVVTLFQSTFTEDIFQFKQTCFPLQEAWKGLVNIEKERFEADNDKHESFEHQREHMVSAKRIKRELQLRTCLSETMQRYHTIINESKSSSASLQYIFGFLEDQIYHMVNTNTKQDLVKILQLERSMCRRQVRQVATSAVAKSEVNATEECESKARAQLTHQEMISECSKLYQNLRAKNLGCEHFLRELGQLYEAFKEIGNSPTQPSLNSADIVLLPQLAAQLVAEMHSLEILDGDTESVPLTWVTSVLDALTAQLGDPKVIVLSVIGVQSSGKSTFLNSMFGLRFPVRAGRCTRGLFIRFLQIDPRLADELGCKYLIVVDSEGIRSLVHDDLRFDHELVTLALGIANVTIFNIEGENIGRDMTGVLQVAAHALMRMKEVDIECCCRIVQQRVSDLTAGDRNKANTNNIIETLNQATKFAAEEEGLEGRYEFFADVVDLRVDENLQYIPCLWTGGMSPPNHMYSETIGKIKRQLFGEIRDKSIESNLTLSTFTERIRDVWKAVKEEDFVFNFQDSVRAVDFNKFCLEYNKWIAQMRFQMILKTNELLQEVEVCAKDELSITEMKDELSNKVEEQRQYLRSSVEDYIANHPRKKTILKYKKGFLDDMNVVLKDVENHATTLLKEEYELQKVQSTKNLTNFKASWRQRLAIEAKNLATAMTDDSVILLVFEQHWGKWKQFIKEECENSKIQTNESSLQIVCEKLLLKITRDMAVGSEIQILISKEGGIEKHKDLRNECSKYIHNKFVKAWIKHTTLPDEKKENNEIEEQLINAKREEATNFVVEVARKEYSKMKMEQTGKPFDANIYQLMLQNIIKVLSEKRENFKPPHALIAKCLLYISGKSLEWLLDNEKAHRNNYGALLALEKEMLFDDFLAFCTGRNHSLRAADFIYYFIEPIYLKKFEAAQMDLKHQQDTLLPSYGVSPWDVLSFVCKKFSSSSYRLFKTLIVSPLESSYELYVEQKRLEDLSHLRQQLCSASNALISELVGLINHSLFILPYHNPLQSMCSFLAANLDCPFITTAGDIYNVNNLGEVCSYLISMINDRLSGTLQHKIFLTDFHVGRTFYCDSVCPMCGTPCDSQLRVHEKHFSFLHRPRGFKGATYADSNKLVLEDCPSSILCKSAEFKYQGRTSLCQKYRHVAPDWDIFPSFRDNCGRIFWQWLLVKYNEDIASLYKCEPADIPHSWRSITREFALESLRMDKLAKISGRSSVNWPSLTVPPLPNLHYGFLS